MFKLDKKEYIDDIASTGYIYTHHSGGKLVFIENDDDNRVFSIAFRTLSENDKGTAHIVEHCVLCGSENYKIKDPFNILDKGSMHTYLNAMTYEDKTVFPIGSTNEQDFKAMLRVYCDAVFKPMMYQNEGIFRQEGWYSDGETLNGVVLIEMKGVYSDSSVVLEEALNKKLYGGTPYGYDSGGNPDKIPELSYEEFLEFHNKNYHPSNSVIYLYGKLDINEYMDILDNEFIGVFEYRENKFEPPVIKPDYSDTFVFEPTTTGKNVLQALYHTGTVDDFSKCIMLDVLCDLFFNIEGAFIKDQIRDLGDQVSASFSDSAYLTSFSVEVTGSDEINLVSFRNRLNEAFKNFVVDKYKLQGVINSYKFYFKEEDFGYKPKGLFYNTLLLRAFMYNNYTFEPLKINRLFENIKTMDIKKLIEEYFVNKGCYGILISTEKESKEVNVPEKNNISLDQYQSQKDDPNEIKKINISKVSDISKEPFLLKYEEIDGNLFVPAKCDVTYFDIMFDTSVIPKEYLPALGIWQSIIDVYNIRYSNDIDYYLGGLNTALKTVSIGNGYKPFMTIRIKSINQNVGKAIDMFKKVVAQTCNNLSRLEELVNEQKQVLINRFISSGHIRGYIKAMAVFSEEYNYIDYVAGTKLYEYIINTPIEKIQNDINAVIRLLFNKRGVFYSMCGKDFIDKEIMLFEFDDFEPVHYSYDLGVQESVAVKTNINFNCMAFPIDCKNGSFKALQQLITREYMWDKVRLEGGAYGGGCMFADGRRCYMYSYRDPQLGKTYEAFKNVGEYLTKSKTQGEIDRFILGAINVSDSPVKNSFLNPIAIKRYMHNVTEDMLYQRREELLNTKSTDIVELGYKMTEAMQHNGVCTVGKQEDIEKNIDLLDKFIVL